VRKVITVDDGDDLTPFIETASALIDVLCAASTYGAAQFELIERWLAAHYYACDRVRTERQAVSGAVSEEAVKMKFDLMLNNTVYGQQAMILDTDGSLAAHNNTLQDVKTVLPGSGQRVTWLGSNYHPYPPR
jgi:hypothetical protein